MPTETTEPSSPTARDVRVRAKFSQTAAAALAGVSPGTWRVWEANKKAVSAERNALCEAALIKLAAMANEAA